MTIFSLWMEHKLAYRFYHIAASVTARITQKPIIESCWAIKDLNAGDLVAPMLLKSYGFTPVFSHRTEARLFSCGSLLDKVPTNFSGYILGTGLMHGDVIKSLPDARILAVRGELTRNNIGAPRDTILGDPGLLVARCLTSTRKKRFALGVIPHFTDNKDPRLHNLLRRYKKEILFINIQTTPLAVLKQIDQCEYILSSSLHGMVFADSVGVPNAWIILSDRVQGKGFKFHDYGSALKWKRDPVLIFGDEKLSELITQTSLPSLSIIEETKNNLDHAYHLLKQEFPARKLR
jgi:pyruvyltransferase